MKKASDLSPRSCPNCGAPVRNGECEYCGTVFYTAKVGETDKYSGISYLAHSAEERTVRVFDPKSQTWKYVPEKATVSTEENPLLAVVTSDPIINYRRW